MCKPNDTRHQTMSHYQSSAKKRSLTGSKSCRRRSVTFSSKVSFSSEPEVIAGSPIHSSKHFNEKYDHDFHESWLNICELEQIKDSIKEQAKKYRILSSKAISSSARMSSLVFPFRNCGVYKKMKYLIKVQNILDEDETLCGRSSNGKLSKKFRPEFRGLENRIFVERQRNRSIAMNTILEFQRRTKSMIEEAERNNKSESEISLMRDQYATRLSTICSQLSQWSKDEALALARLDAEGVFGVPEKHCQDVDKGMSTLVRENNRYLGSIKESSSKRKRSSLSNSDIPMWVGQQERQVKRSRTNTIDNICLNVNI
jgi:hypothetical protein